MFRNDNLLGRRRFGRFCVKPVLILTAASLMGLSIPATVSAEDEVFSGPQPGEKLAAFKVQGVYDKAAGKEFAPLDEADGKPTMLVFVHKITRPGLGLVRGLTNYAKSQSETPSFSAVVWLDDDKAEAESFLNRARKSLNLQVPVGISIDGGEGPGAYGLNRNVELTILVANENKVVANFALVQPSMTDGVKIAGEFAKAIGKKPPTADELQKIAYPGRQMNMQRRQRTRAQQGRRPANERPSGESQPKKADDDS